MTKSIFLAVLLSSRANAATYKCDIKFGFIDKTRSEVKTFQRNITNNNKDSVIYKDKDVDVYFKITEKGVTFLTIYYNNFGTFSSAVGIPRNSYLAISTEASNSFADIYCKINGE